MHECMYVYIYVHVCIYIYICTYTHTHTHAHLVFASGFHAGVGVKCSLFLVAGLGGSRGSGAKFVLLGCGTGVV